jgi:hypothetical protein
MSKRRRSSAVLSNVEARRSLFFAMQSRRIALFILTNLSILTFVSNFASVAGPFSGRKCKKLEKTPRPPPSPTFKKSGNDYNLRKDVDAERVFLYYNRAFGIFQPPERENRPSTRDFPTFPAKKAEKRPLDGAPLPNAPPFRFVFAVVPFPFPEIATRTPDAVAASPFESLDRPL